MHCELLLWMQWSGAKRGGIPRNEAVIYCYQHLNMPCISSESNPKRRYFSEDRLYVEVTSPGQGVRIAPKKIHIRLLSSVDWRVCVESICSICMR